MPSRKKKKHWANYINKQFKLGSNQENKMGFLDYIIGLSLISRITIKI